MAVRFLRTLIFASLLALGGNYGNYPVHSFRPSLISVALARNSLEVPPHTSQVIDLAGVLNEGEQQQLRASLELFQKEYGPQIQVLTIPSLEGEAIEPYSIRVVDAWKLGDKKRDDGVLLLVSVQDREVRIEVGQGLEGILPDILAGRIIRDVMIPFFKQGRISAGIVAGLNAIAARLGGTLKDIPVYASPQNAQRTQSSGLGKILFLLILFFIILPRLFGRRERTYRQQRGGDFLTGLLLGNIWGRRRGGGGGSSGWGGGGFGGGGGGGFSGGGASGKW